MARASAAMRELAAWYEVFRVARPPRINGEALDDLDVDLYEEEAYVAGLCSKYLKTGSIAPHTEVTLNKRIDMRIDTIALSKHLAPEELFALKKYREDMVKLARLLTMAACVQMRWN